jgi:hypothetical protein
MKWKVKHIFNFTKDKLWGAGFCQFGFHDNKGNQYMLQWDEHWLGQLTPDDRFLWTAGSVDKSLSVIHINADIKNPHYICGSPDGSLLLSSNGNSKIYKIYPGKRTTELFIDTADFGIKEFDVGNCVYDLKGNIWVNDIRGCKVWLFAGNGRLLRCLGDGTPGFQKGPVPFDRVRFNWIYDIRLGQDGNIYVLDSKNFAVRMIDIGREVVTTIVGMGKPGYSGDGGDASNATLGSNPAEYFDGPLSLSLDEEDNIYIGDTQNHVLRMVEKATNIITTIAGEKNARRHERNDPREQDPLQLKLPYICSLEYYHGFLFVPEWDGDLVVLEKV